MSFLHLDTAYTDQWSNLTLAFGSDRILLDNSDEFRLSAKEIDYLDALTKRFRETARLVLPLPSVFARGVREIVPDSAPHDRHRALKTLQGLRRGRILAEAQRVDIDSKLLHAFEIELGAHIQEVP